MAYVDPSIGKAQRIRYAVVFWILGSQDSDSIADQLGEGFLIENEFAISELTRIIIEISHDETDVEKCSECLC